jgi:FAD/FMN-containing dehydrogenase
MLCVAFYSRHALAEIELWRNCNGKRCESHMATPTIQNFGANQVWRPHAFLAPTSETELLALLRRQRGHRFRAIGRLHSWSRAPVGNDVLLDLRHLNSIAIHTDSDGPWVEVGAGCQVKRLLDYLNRRGYTLPSVGLIDEQTVAGATATGTHGSGRQSLAHFIQAVRLACYDPQTHEPILRTISAGKELEAARCSLGCLGIITSLRLPIRKQYHVEEHLCSYAHLEEVLAQEEKFPIQQFYLLPWRWDFLAQRRREVGQPVSRFVALYRLYWAIGIDVGLHLTLTFLARNLPSSCTRFFFRRLLLAFVPRRPFIDQSQRQLTMQHELFRHIEMEIFVKRSVLASALACVREVLQRFSDTGSYTHHYVICIRKVLPDATLISMSNGWEEPAYAVSFISYVKPDQRAGFFALAHELATTLAERFDGRPHWGKYCPLPVNELRRLYPGWRDFAAIVKTADPGSAFSNEWFDAVFGFAESNST